MATTPFDAERHLEAGLAALGLGLQPEWRATTLLHLAAIAKAAEVVMAAELDEDIVAAPVFTA